MPFAMKICETQVWCGDQLVSDHKPGEHKKEKGDYSGSLHIAAGLNWPASETFCTLWGNLPESRVEFHAWKVCVSSGWCLGSLPRTLDKTFGEEFSLHRKIPSTNCKSLLLWVSYSDTFESSNKFHLSNLKYWHVTVLYNHRSISTFRTGID